jgi:hypothetical protein
MLSHCKQAGALGEGAGFRGQSFVLGRASLVSWGKRADGMNCVLRSA